MLRDSVTGKTHRRVRSRLQICRQDLTTYDEITAEIFQQEKKEQKFTITQHMKQLSTVYNDPINNDDVSFMSL